MGEGQLPQTDPLFHQLNLKAPGDSRRLLSSWKLPGGHLFPSKQTPRTTYLQCQELKEIPQDFPGPRASCFWMLFMLLGEETTLLPKTWPLTEPWRTREANAPPFEEDMCIFAQLSAPCPAEGREEDGGSRGRNLCRRDGMSTRRESVAVMRRAPEAPLPLSPGPCREAATAYWGQTGGAVMLLVLRARREVQQLRKAREWPERLPEPSSATRANPEAAAGTGAALALG